MKVSYTWLKRYVPELPEASMLEDVFTQHLCEVESVEKKSEEEFLFDLGILPNRAHDLLSHEGVARELSGLLGLPYKDPNTYVAPEVRKTILQITVESELCRRYMGRIVRGVTVGPSPEWLVQALTSIGQRSINTIVDATNLVMFDCGQPTHAFDLQKISGEALTIRAARSGEKMTTLGGVSLGNSDAVGDHTGSEIELTESNLVIADAAGVLALAGVKGGNKAEVDTTTTDIVIEVANFDPVSVRKTARKNNLLTESAKRFENDLSPELATHAMHKLSSLIAKLCPEAQFEECIDIYPNPHAVREVSFSLDAVSRILGMKIEPEQAEKILMQYGYSYTRADDRMSTDSAGAHADTVFVLQVPPLRLDLVGTHDIAEEFGRIIGYDAIEPELLIRLNMPQKNEAYEHMRAARQKLLSEGYREVMTYSFAKKGKISVARGAKGKEFLRTNLSDGLREAYERNRLNAPLLGLSEIKLFEIGTVFPTEKIENTEGRGEVGGVEEIHVAYVDKKELVEKTVEEFSHNLPPVTADAIETGEKNNAGEAFDKKDFSHEQESDSKTETFVPWSIYPFISRDIAVWVTDTESEKKLETILATFAQTYCVRPPQMFDTFSKDGRTSVAFRLVFQAMDRTLTDSEVETWFAELVSLIAKETTMEIR